MKTACILHSFLPRYRSSRRGALPVDPQRGGLTVLELMIVVSVIAVVAAIAIPSLAHAKKVGNEASAFSALRSISTVNTQYRTRFGVFSDSLADLEAAGYLGFNEATPKGGYSFLYARAGNAWACNASPITFGQEGDRSFYIDESGVIRFADGVPAMGADAPLD